MSRWVFSAARDHRRSALAQVVFVVVLVQCLAPTAAAQGSSGEAARHYEAGRSAFVAHRYDEAVREFRAAYAISHDPLLLFNIGVAYEDSSQWNEAIRAYREYLAALPSAPNRNDVERRLHVLETLSETARTAQNTPAVTPAPAAAPAVTPAASTPAATPRDTGGVPIPPVAMMAGGGVLLVAGAVVGALALGTRGRLEMQCFGDVTRCPDTSDNRDTHQALVTQSLVSDVLLGAGAVLAVGGAVWFMLSSRTRAGSEHATAVVVGDRWIGLRGSF